MSVIYLPEIVLFSGAGAFRDIYPTGTIYFPKAETAPGAGDDVYDATRLELDPNNWTFIPYPPVAPAVSVTTDTSVTLEYVYGAEYSKNGGINWDSPVPGQDMVFTGLTPNTTYTFDVRIAAEAGTTQWPAPGHSASALAYATATTLPAAGGGNTGGNSPVPPIDETVKPGTDKPEEKPEVTEPEVTEPTSEPTSEPAEPTETPLPTQEPTAEPTLPIVEPTDDAQGGTGGAGENGNTDGVAGVDTGDAGVDTGDAGVAVWLGIAALSAAVFVIVKKLRYT